MTLYVLNTDREEIAVIDGFKSLIWTKRYFVCGDFELQIPADRSMIPILQPDNFIVRDDDDSVMIIEKLEIQTDVEDGDFYLVSGRSAESLLMRRIFREQFILNNTGTLAQAVSAFVTECTTVKNPHRWDHPQQYRVIQGLVVDTSSVIAGKMQVQFTGQTLYDAIVSVCQPRDVGFKIARSGTDLVLSLYEGTEKEVIFSPDFDNLINSKYLYDTSNLANTAVIAGEGEGDERRIATIETAPQTDRIWGYELRELFVDARDVSSNNDEIITPEYNNMLFARGDEKLAEHSLMKSFEAEVEPNTTFRYKTDYNLGDIVTVTNEYGVTAKPRIVEIIESWDDTGYKMVPTFDAMAMATVLILKDSDGYILKDSTGEFISVEG